MSGNIPKNLKTKAYRMVRLAVQSGALIRLPCRVCGTVKSEAHHEDYTKPLEVDWLCRKHHRDRRKELGDWANKPRKRKRYLLYGRAMLLYAAGHSLSKISKAIGASKTSIHEWISSSNKTKFD